MLIADMNHVLDALDRIGDKIESSEAYLRLGELFPEQRELIRERYARDCYGWGREDISADELIFARALFDKEMAKFDAEEKS